MKNDDYPPYVGFIGDNYRCWAGNCMRLAHKKYTIFKVSLSVRIEARRYCKKCYLQTLHEPHSYSLPSFATPEEALIYLTTRKLENETTH